MWVQVLYKRRDCSWIRGREFICAKKAIASEYIGKLKNDQDVTEIVLHKIYGEGEYPRIVRRVK